MNSFPILVYFIKMVTIVDIEEHTEGPFCFASLQVCNDAASVRIQRPAAVPGCWYSIENREYDV